MIVTCVHVYVKEAHIQDFIEATTRNHENSIKEPDNLRFDVLQDAGNPSKFLLYEAYTTEEAVATHKQTQHYLTWRETVAPWMAQEREGIRHHVICPTDTSLW